MTEAKNLYQNRRSVYALGKNLPISEQEALEIIDNAVKYSPSAFNSQTAHAVVLLGENHQKLWDITFGELEKFLPNEILIFNIRLVEDYREVEIISSGEYKKIEERIRENW